MLQQEPSGQSQDYFQPGMFRRRLGPLQETHGGDTQIHTNKRTASHRHKMTGCVGRFGADGCRGFFFAFPSHFLFFILRKQVEVLGKKTSGRDFFFRTQTAAGQILTNQNDVGMSMTCPPHLRHVCSVCKIEICATRGLWLSKPGQTKLMQTQ